MLGSIHSYIPTSKSTSGVGSAGSRGAAPDPEHAADAGKASRRVARCRCTDQDVKALAVAGLHPGLPVDRPAGALGFERGELRAEIPAAVLVDENCQRFADEVLLRAAQQLRGSTIRLADIAARVGLEVCLGGEIEELRVALALDRQPVAQARQLLGRDP